MARILIVDDDPDVVESTQIVLENEGFDVISASNITDGKSMVDSENPDLIVLDVMMDAPDDGFVMAQELRARKIETPIVMMTSVGKTFGLDFDKDSEMVPVDEYIEKPVEPKVLVSKIKALLGKS
ncbi:MAG: response regulator [Planctomycetota bacterium]|nr:response regulator [Planctomycetota bacterium]